MSVSAEVPKGLLEFDTKERTATMVVDESLYPLSAIYGAAYVFIDRAYVFLDRPEDNKVRVSLAAKGEAEDGALEALVGAFSNELLSCAWRNQITQDNRVLIETVTVQAIAGAMGEPSLDDLADFDFTDDALDDPLGIAQSWEEKHGKKDPAGDKSEGAA